MSTPTIVDDRDSSIEYVGDWSGSFAVFHFSDVVDISVWATIAADLMAPKVSFQIDDQQATVFSTTMPKDTQHHQQFFEATGSNLSSGQHTLKMTSLQEGGYFYLDYIIIIPSNFSDMSISETTATVTVFTSPTISSSAEQSNIPTVSNSQTGPSSRKLAIAGGVLGAIALLTVIIAFAWWIIARKRRHYKAKKFRNESRQRLNCSPWKIQQPIFKDPTDQEYGQTMSTTNPTVFQNCLPAEKLELES
ncbi:hypothetical protein CPC08DRAFT_771171 [Agrocybe pediades]|nr:hypothetical protein CPC08DRAFT_771171 [Agrocybe pediades]